MGHVKDRDNGYRATLSAVRAAAKGSSVSVGILGKDMGQAAAKGTPGQTLGDVATQNEFGLGVPERSFIRGWYDESYQKNVATIKTLWRSVVDGTRTAAQVWELLGLKFKGDIQKRIADVIPPPNAASTIKRKGSSVPLIDSGQTRSAVDYEVSSDAR